MSGSYFYCICKKPGKYICSKCRDIVYCSKKCQIKHWSVHKWTCCSQFLKCPNPKKFSISSISEMSDIVNKLSTNSFCKYCYIKRKFKKKFRFFNMILHKKKHGVSIKFYVVYPILNQKLINIAPVSYYYIIILFVTKSFPDTIFIKILTSTMAIKTKFQIDTHRDYIWGKRIHSDAILEVITKGQLKNIVMSFLNWKTFDIAKVLYIKDIPDESLSPIDFKTYTNISHRKLMVKKIKKKYFCCFCENLNDIFYVPTYNNVLCQSCINIQRRLGKVDHFKRMRPIVNNKIQLNKSDFIYGLI